MHRFALPILAAAAALAPAVARADTPTGGVATYALVVGSNTGGAGQAALHYSEDDARRVAATLTELGGYAPDQVDVLVHPSPDELRAHLAQLSTRVAADLAAGRQARVLFYYSGHARAEAIDLGFEELPLAELRQRLFAVPATLTVVVLDACQSGAFSRVKGAAPAADFSFNSRQHLDASGIAVLASSSGSELSQESEQLRSSYFTHHLLVGLRGAGDANHDGQVSIDEAYRYAYHQTLLATAETAVGGQHVTFEADLKGHGEVPLSYPRAATAAIELPASLEGQTLVEDKRAHTVVAETYKARGAAVRIAVAPGDYQVIVRRGDHLSRCDVTAAAAPGAIDVDRCPTEAIVATASKGSAPRPLWFELTAGAGAERHDGFTDTLTAFGYHEHGLEPGAGLAISVVRQVERRLWVGGFAQLASAPAWSMDTERMPLRFGWNTLVVGGLARGVQPFAKHWSAYAQAGAGVGLGFTHFADQDDATQNEHYLGWAFTAGAGLHVDQMWGTPLGASLGYQFDYAPIIDNKIGDTHASGGHRITFGLSYRL